VKSERLAASWGEGTRLAKALIPAGALFLLLVFTRSKLEMPLKRPIMPDQKSTDPFKPEQPRIPGLDPAEGKIKLSPPAPAVYSPATPQDKAPPSPMRWIVVTVLGAFALLGFGLLYWMKSFPAKAVGIASSSGTAVPAEVESKAIQSLPAGPGAIAATEDLPRAWSSKRFLFRDAVSSQLQPAMVVRLPGGQYWGFSLREPFGNCELELVTDLPRLKSQYGLKADHPMVANPCSHTVYDLLRYGDGAPNNGLVRGEIVQGTGLRPPVAIEIVVKGKDVIAVRME
jgi:hypothetical protein